MNTDIKNRIEEAVRNINVEALVETYCKQLILDIQKVADALLGIDRSWNRIEIKSGAINDLIQDRVETFVRDRYATLIEQAIDEIKITAKIQTAITGRVKRTIDEAIYEQTHSYRVTPFKGRIEALVNKEIELAIDRYANEHENCTLQDATPAQEPVLRNTRTKTKTRS